MSIHILKRLFITFSLLLPALFCSAQQWDLSGVIFEPDGTTPLIGVVAMIKGETTGTVSDINGAYTLKVAKGQIVLFSSLGYKTQEVKIIDQKNLNITLREDIVQMDEVVVTALGMSRQEKALGYSISKIDGDEITSTVSSNWLNSLNGKVAGLNLDQASTGPGGSIRVTLRGEGSLSHNSNEALIVVDGIPISSSMTASTSASSYTDVDAPVDFGNGASDLNPDDIESVSVLKGPSATALYGSRAANGAIVITTKSGRKTKGIGVSYSFSSTFEQAGYWPDFQEEYGAGSSSQRDYSFWTIKKPELTLENETATRNHSRYAFGPRYQGQMFYQYASRNWEDGTYEKLPWVARDWYKGFFQTGTTFKNTLSIDGNDGKGTSYRLSFTDTRNDWIIPNTGYTNQAVSLAVNTKLNKYINSSAKINYLRKQSDNLPMTGYSEASPMYTLMWNANNADISWYYDEWVNKRITRESVNNKENLNYLTDNPYMQVYEQLNSMSRNRVYGNISVDAQLAKNLKLTVRSGIDFSDEFRTQQKPKESIKYIDGFYKEQVIRRYEMNNDFMLMYDKQAGDLAINVMVGGNNMVNNYSNHQISCEKLDLPGVYNIANSASPYIVNSARTNKSINSFYGTLSLGWRSMLYLDVTGRNDWSSALASGNNSYFYPSVSASILFDQVFNFETNAPWVNMLKGRLSWANVGNDTDPYKLMHYYGNSEFASSFYMPGDMNNYNLKPENVRSYEAGIDARLFNNRVSFDIAYYNASTTNQIITVPMDQITGATSQMVNAGEVNNQGIEIMAKVTPIRTKRFNWDVSVNWSKNWNKLVELAPGVDVWQMNRSNTVGSRVYIYAYPGEDLGSIYGMGWKRAPKDAVVVDNKGNTVNCGGQVIVDADGLPVIDTEKQRLGSIFPDWKGGMTHTLRYKNLSLTMVFNGQMGGKCYSVTNSILSYQGKLKNSLPGRYDGLVHAGVNYNEATGVYTQNTTITSDIQDYYNKRVWNRDNAEMNTFSTSFLKFKEARLDFSLPKKVVQNIRFLEGASLGVYATNLFCITNFPQYDPEAATMNGSSISKGIEVGAYPLTRTYGLNFKVQF
ncbi:MAG: SusC/RagA family TonB-linked outer membrane protein [Marinifilaceae bacterium]